jgi:hypothetical protein
MNINKIKNILNNKLLSNGIALQSQYICNIFPGSGIYNNNKISSALNSLGSGLPGLGSSIAQNLISKSTKQLSILAQAVSIPGRSFLTTEHKMFGVERKMPYGVQYEPIDITFICTNNMLERSFFNIWHQYIMDPESQYMEYYNDYVGQIQIIKVDNSNTENELSPEGLTRNLTQGLNTYTLYDAYPLTIQSQEMSYESDDYLTLTVQFAYSRWVSGVDSVNVGNILNSAFGVKVF